MAVAGRFDPAKTGFGESVDRGNLTLGGHFDRLMLKTVSRKTLADHHGIGHGFPPPFYSVRSRAETGLCVDIVNSERKIIMVGKKSEMKGERKSANVAEAATIRDLISYRVSRAAGLMSRSAALRFRRESDVSLGEWRAIALLSATPGVSLMQLARESGLDKAQMSRVVSSLIERGLVTRCPSPAGRRAVELNLSDDGKARYAALIAAARDRDQAFRAALSPQELESLQSALDRLSRTAKDFIVAETDGALPED